MPRRTPIPRSGFPTTPSGWKATEIKTSLSTSGPGEPPADFPGIGLVRQQVSLDEWYAYWGLAKVLKQPRDPRTPPYQGYPGLWAYQVPVLLRNQLIPRESGSDVLDFVVYFGGAKIGIRVQSDLHVFGTFGGSQQIARDKFSKAHLEGYDAVIDVFSQHFLDDPTGQKVCQVMRDAIHMRERPSPILYGNAQHARPKGLVR